MQKPVFILFLLFLLVESCKKHSCESAECSFIATYHIYGTSTFYLGGTSDPPTTIDTTVIIAKLNATSYLMNGNTFDYWDPNPTYLPQFNKYRWIRTNHDMSVLMFHKVADDSVFYSANNGSFGGGVSTEWAGVKVQ